MAYKGLREEVSRVKGLPLKGISYNKEQKAAGTCLQKAKRKATLTHY